MFKIFVAKPNFFIIILLSILLVVVIQFENESLLKDNTEMAAMGITLLSFFLNGFTLQSSRLLKNNMYNIFFLFIFMWVSDITLLDLQYSIAFFICSIIQFMITSEKYQETNNTYIIFGILAFSANFFFYPTVSFSIMILFLALSFSRNRKASIQFIITYLFCFFVLFQILILLDESYKIQDFFCNMRWFEWQEFQSMLYFIPISIFVLLSWIDHFSKSAMQSRLKRNLYNIYVLLFVLQIIGILVISGSFDAQISFLYFPLSLFIGRFVAYIKNPYIQNIAMLLSLLSIAFLKMLEFSFL